MKCVSVAEAKNTLPALIHEADEGPIEIRRRDKPVAVIVAHHEFERMRLASQKRPRTWTALLKWREKYREALGTLDLASILEDTRDQKAARPVKW
jgi:antitoxin (DNA-binding transcriptional repressor) of toxin-antitoxin stability system